MAGEQFPRTVELLRSADEAAAQFRAEAEQRSMREQGRFLPPGVEQGDVVHVLTRNVDALAQRKRRFNFSFLEEQHKQKQQQQQPPLSPVDTASPDVASAFSHAASLGVFASPPVSPVAQPPAAATAAAAAAAASSVQAAIESSRRLLVDVAQLQHQHIARGKKPPRHTQTLPAVERLHTPDAVRMVGRRGSGSGDGGGGNAAARKRRRRARAAGQPSNPHEKKSAEAAGEGEGGAGSVGGGGAGGIVGGGGSAGGDSGGVAGGGASKPERDGFMTAVNVAPLSGEVGEGSGGGGGGGGGGPLGSQDDAYIDPQTRFVVSKRLRQYVSRSHRRVLRCRYGASRTDFISSEELAQRCGRTPQQIVQRAGGGPAAATAATVPPPLILPPTSGAFTARRPGTAGEPSPFQKCNVVTPRADLDEVENDRQYSVQCIRRRARQSRSRSCAARAALAVPYPPPAAAAATATAAASAQRQGRPVEDIDDCEGGSEEGGTAEENEEGPRRKRGEGGERRGVFITQGEGASGSGGGGGGGGSGGEGQAEGVVSLRVPPRSTAGDVTLPDVVRDMAIELAYQECGVDYNLTAFPGQSMKGTVVNYYNEGVLRDLPADTRHTDGSGGGSGGDAPEAGLSYTGSAEYTGGQYCLNYRRLQLSSGGRDAEGGEDGGALKGETVPIAKGFCRVPYDAFRKTLGARENRLNARSVRELERCDARRRCFFNQKYEVLAAVTDRASENKSKYGHWGPACVELHRSILSLAVARDTTERRMRRDAFLRRSQDIVDYYYPHVPDCTALLEKMRGLFDAEDEQVQGTLCGGGEGQEPAAAAPAGVLNARLFFSLLATFEASRFLQEGFCALISLVKPLFQVSDAMWQQFLQETFRSFEGPSIDLLVEQHKNLGGGAWGGDASQPTPTRTFPARIRIKVHCARGVATDADGASAAALMVVLRCKHMWAARSSSQAAPVSEAPTAETPTHLPAGALSGAECMSDPSEMRGEHKTSVLYGTSKPVWNEDFVLALADERAVLECLLYDLRDLRDGPAASCMVNLATDDLHLRCNVKTKATLLLRRQRGAGVGPAGTAASARRGGGGNGGGRQDPDLPHDTSFSMDCDPQQASKGAADEAAGGAPEGGSGAGSPRTQTYKAPLSKQTRVGHSCTLGGGGGGGGSDPAHEGELVLYLQPLNFSAVEPPPPPLPPRPSAGSSRGAAPPPPPPPPPLQRSRQSLSGSVMGESSVRAPTVTPLSVLAGPRPPDRKCSRSSGRGPVVGFVEA